MCVYVYSKWKSKALEESRGILAFVTSLSVWRIQRDRKVSLEVKISRETPSRDRKLIVK